GEPLAGGELLAGGEPFLTTSRAPSRPAGVSLWPALDRNGPAADGAGATGATAPSVSLETLAAAAGPRVLVACATMDARASLAARWAARRASPATSYPGVAACAAGGRTSARKAAPAAITVSAQTLARTPILVVAEDRMYHH